MSAACRGRSAACCRISSSGRDATGARRAVDAPRRARRAAGGRAARHHPRGRCPPGERCLVTGGGPDRVPLGRGAHGARHHRHRPERAARGPARAVRAARRPHRHARRARRCPDAARSRRRAVRRRARVLGPPAAMEPALGQLQRAGMLVLVGAGIAAPVRPQPHPAERARDHRRVRATTPTGSSARSSCSLGPASARPARRADDVALDGLLDARSGCTRASSRPRSWSYPVGPKEHDDLRPRRERRADVRVRKPRFNHVAMSLPAGAARRGAPQAALRLLRRGVRLATSSRRSTDDRKRLVFQVYAIEQFVFLIADDAPMTCAAPRPLRPLGRHRGRARRRARQAKAYKERDDRVDIIDKQGRRPRHARDHPHLHRVTCCR